MEQLQLLPMIVCFLITILLLLLLLMRGFTRKGNQIPGPSKLPIIGSMHHLLLGSTPPHHRFRDLAEKYGPLMLLRLGQVDHLVVSSAEAAEQVLKTQDPKFASRPVLSGIDLLTYGGITLTFSPYGNYTRQLRKVYTAQVFSAARVKSFRSLREEEVTNLVREISILSRDNEPIDVTQKIKALTNSITFGVVMGKKYRQHQEKYLNIFQEQMKLISLFGIVDLFPSFKLLVNIVVSRAKSKLERLHKAMDSVLHEIVEEHAAKLAFKKDNHDVYEEEEDDLVDWVLRLQDSDDGLMGGIPLTTDKVKAIIGELFGGGNAASSVAIEWVMAELMKNPETMKEAQMEIRQAARGKAKLEESDVSKLKFLKLVIMETLRLHPPGPMLIRVCRESCRVQGYEIPEGMRVLVNVWALARDAKYWEDADSFKPERFQGSAISFKGTDSCFIPFGAGIRMCPGMTFGMANVEIALANLLFYFDWKLPPGMKANELDMTGTFSGIVSRKNKLCLFATTRIRLPVG